MTIWQTLMIAACLALLAGAAPAQEQPMFGGIARTAEQSAADRAFVDEALKQGSREDVAAQLVTEAWQALDEGNLDAAMVRFNRAWLVEPSRGDTQWGFAIVSHLLGAPLEQIEKHFGLAEAASGGDADFQAAHGRVLFEHRKFRQSTLYFLKALEIDPANKTAHTGMWYASQELGDAATAEKHRSLAEQ